MTRTERGRWGGGCCPEGDGGGRKVGTGRTGPGGEERQGGAGRCGGARGGEQRAGGQAVDVRLPRGLRGHALEGGGQVRGYGEPGDHGLAGARPAARRETPAGSRAPAQGGPAPTPPPPPPPPPPPAPPTPAPPLSP